MFPSPETLFAPTTAAAFRSEHQGLRWLHVPGAREKFAAMMDWEKLNQLLGLGVWSQASLKLFVEGRPVPPDQYCQMTVGREHRQMAAPVPDAVRRWMRNGAALVLNEIETLNPGLRDCATTLEAFFGAKVSMNLYCSFKEKRAFASHFDNHDVIAFHFEGEKQWRIYENRADFPIEHPAFQNMPQAEFDRMKGKVAAEITLRPGDLLYLPRGTFHDAMSLTDGSLHVSCSLTSPIGLEWLSRLWEMAVRDPVFRMDLPYADSPEGAAQLRAHIGRLREQFTRLMQSDDAMAQAQALRAPRAQAAPLDLPGDGPQRKG